MRFRPLRCTPAADEMDRVQVADAQTTEVRLALVMNGGVSLAVWMGGVAHELDLLRRASRGDDAEDVAVGDRQVFKLWKRLANDARKKVRIDVISGTSAGGLNGMLLATAIGRGSALPDLREMWGSASLESLLPQASDSDESVLSGKSLENKIRDALAAVPEMPEPDTETITLFLTATALDGQSRAFKDSFEQHFDVRDHRRVYRFKNQRPGGGAQRYRKENGTWKFGPDEPKHFASANEFALLRAARATASFPIAFQPVSELPLLDHRVRPDPTYGDPASCVMDGGVLNNAPFSPVLDEITKRRVTTRPVERALVFVVPSAARLEDEKVTQQRCHEIRPGVVGLSALNYPQEVDLRSGTEDIGQRVQTSVRGTRENLFERLVTDTGTQDRKQMQEAAQSLLDEYRRSRVNAVLLDPVVGYTSTGAVTSLAPLPEVDDDTIADILDRPLSWFPPGDEQLSDPNVDHWPWGIITAERLLQTLGHYLHELLRPTRGRAPNLSPEKQAVLVEGTANISTRLREALAVREAVRTELGSRHLLDGGLGEMQAALLADQVFNELNVPEVVGRLVNEAATCFLRTLKQTTPGPHCRKHEDVISAYLTVEVLTQAFAPPAKVIDNLTPKFKFLRLGPDDMGPLFHEDWSACLGDKKLYGIRFRHFGAFINKEWRQSDFVWGRLDAAHYLLPLLLPDEADRQEERTLHEAILAAEELPGEEGDSPTERMRKRLADLATKSDAQLLADQDAKPVKKTGDKLIGVMVKKQPLRFIAGLVWHRTWVIWRKGHEQGEQVSLRDAAKSALAQIVIAPLMLGSAFIGAAIVALICYL